MLRVAVDGTPLLGTRTGVARLVQGLLATLAGRDDLELTAYAVTLRGAKELGSAVPAGVRAAGRPFPARLVRAVWERGLGPGVARWTGPVDVVHATNFVAPPVRIPTLLTIHDLTVVRFPEMCTRDTLRYPHAIRRALARNARIHTTTRFVAAEVAEHFDVPMEQIVHIPPGVDEEAPGDPARGRELAGAERYVLALGTIEPRKNLPRLVEAFDRLAEDDPTLRLVVAGPEGWGADAFTAAVDEARHGDRIVRPGYVAGDERRGLLAGALVFAYPSLYEGFGFPALEAMQAGVPVVAGRAGALPEVLGDAAAFADPDDADDLAATIAGVVDDEERRRSLVHAGSERVARYSWESAAKAFAETYRTLAEEHP